MEEIDERTKAILGKKVIFKDGRTIEATERGVDYEAVVPPETHRATAEIIAGGLRAHEATIDILLRVQEKLGDEITERAVWFFLGMQFFSQTMEEFIKRIAGGE
jgi:hypothetical protein